MRRKKKTIFTLYFLHHFAVNAMNRGELLIVYFYRVLSILTKQKLPYRDSHLLPLACLHLLSPLHQLSLKFIEFLVNLNQIQRTLDSKGGEFFVRNALKSGQLLFHGIHRIHHISYIKLPQNSM